MDIFGTFLNEVKEKPDQIMIYDDRLKLSYSETLQLVNHYAYEIENATKGNNKRILLNLSHSYKIVIAILAVIKTGNSFVPISKKYSSTQYKVLSSICDTDIIITDKHLNDTDMKEIFMADSINKDKDILHTTHQHYSDDDEVYVLFTSGSTGDPKGCSVTYKNLKYIIKNMISISKCNNDSKYCFTTPYTFDVSMTEIFSFMYGASLFVCDTSEYEKFRNFPYFIKQNNLTHLAISPSGLKNMYYSYTEDELNAMGDTLKCVMVAGEAFKKEIFEKWKENKWNYSLWNLYGPTEATVYATGYELSRKKTYSNFIPIGHSLLGATYSIENKDDNGVGELVVGGEGITNGYINNEIEKQKRFFYKENVKFYRTGDLVSINEGLLIHHGRNDEQIQINGIRVELGEIESQILKIPGVHEAVVLYNNNILIATVQLNEQIDIKKMLKQKLPRYMIPNIFRVVESFELNTSNKIDRKKVLKDFLEESKKKKNQYTNEKSETTEIEILSIMKECLQNKGEINSITDDFYECGANSLDTFLFINKLEKKYNKKISVDNMYSLRTAENISNYLLKNAHETKSIVSAKTEYNKIPDLTLKVKDYLYNKNEEVNNMYKALYLQGFYYHHKLNSAITFTYSVSDRFQADQIKEAIQILIKQNNILASKLQEDNNILYFKEYNISEDFKIPEIEFESYDHNMLDFISDNYSHEMYYSRYNGGYLSLFILVKQGNNYTVVGILDHTIADTASISLIKNKLGEILSFNNVSKSLSYKEYCQMINLKNNNIKEALNHWYINKLKLCKTDNKNILFKGDMETDYLKIDISEIPFESNLDIVKHLGYIVGTKVNNILEQEYLSLRTIVNLREYKNFAFKNTLGDLHSSVSMFWRKGNTFEEFSKRADKVFSVFTEELFRHSSYLMNNSNVDETSKNQLKNITDNADIVSINYGGTIEENDLNDYIQSTPKLQEKLFNINKRIYVTAFMCNKKLHVFINKKM